VTTAIPVEGDLPLGALAFAIWEFQAGWWKKTWGALLLLAAATCADTDTELFFPAIVDGSLPGELLIIA